MKGGAERVRGWGVEDWEWEWECGWWEVGGDSSFEMSIGEGCWEE